MLTETIRPIGRFAFAAATRSAILPRIRSRTARPSKSRLSFMQVVPCSCRRDSCRTKTVHSTSNGLNGPNNFGQAEGCFATLLLSKEGWTRRQENITEGIFMGGAAGVVRSRGNADALLTTTYAPV